MRLAPWGEKIAVRLLVLYLCGWMAAPLSLSNAQVAPKAVNTRILETTRLPHDLGTKIEQVTDLNNITGTSIKGGSRPGNGPNLFHSFDFFTVGSKDVAHFLNDHGLPTTNIIARVIGDSAGIREASTIDGILRTNHPLKADDPLNFGTANLFLVNPAGIIFGKDAQLDLRGSFAATTADYLRMTDNSLFHTDLSQPTTLSIGSIEAFGFTGPRPVAILVQGNVNVPTLEVAAGRTLSLIGGNLDIVGIDNSAIAATTTLYAPSGRIDLASVASPGEVVLTTEGEAPRLDVGSFHQLGTINIGPDASVNVEGDPGGAIFVRGGDLFLNQSIFRASTNGSVNHGGTAIDVEVTGDVRMTAGPLAVAEFGASTFGTGNAGNVRIMADNLELIGAPAFNANANIGSRSFSTAADSGDGGFIDITANRVLLRDVTFINTFSRGGGNAGSIHLRTGELELLGGLVPNRSGAFIGTNTFGSGNAGSLEVNAQTVRMVGGQGFTGLTTQVSTGGTGNASPLRVITQTMELLNGAQISSGIFSGSGRGGDIEITADSLLISGLDPRGFSSGLFSSVNFPAPGVAGNIRVTTTGDLTVANGGQINSFSGSFGNSGHIDVRARNLYVTDDAAIISTNFGAGLGGNISIQADSVRLSGRGGLNRFHGIFALGGFVARRAGNISITTGNLEVLDGAVISARTSGIGPAGNIEVTADRLLIAGADPASPSGPFDGIESGIVASTLAFQPRPDLATGNGGSITLNIGTIELRDQGRIQARSTGAGDAGTIQIKTGILSVSSAATLSAESTGTGDAGGISIEAAEVNITGVATSSDPFGADLTGLSARTVTGQGGSLSVTAGKLLITDQGLVTSATSGNGDAGGVRLNVGTLLAEGNSQITSNSADTATGDAGSVTIQGLASLAESVTVTDSAILTQADGTGAGGSISIEANRITLNEATVSASVHNVPLGGSSAEAVGDVNLRAIEFLMAGGRITAETDGSRNAGMIGIAVGTLQARGGAFLSSSSTSTDPGAGAAGSVVIEGLASPAQTVTLTNSVLQTSVAGDGAGGSIIVNAGTIGLHGSTLSASVTDVPAGADRTEDTGNIGLFAADQIVLDQGTLVTAESKGSRDAGTVLIAAGRNFFATDSRVTTEALRETSGGNIAILASDMIRLRDSRITTSVFGPEGTVGGDIFIDPQFILLQNSQILAQATQGRGGNINLAFTQAFLADARSTISASSQFGVSGTVQFNSPVQNLSGALVPLKQSFLSGDVLLNQRCAARAAGGGLSSFLITDNEGLPPAPGGVLPSPVFWEEEPTPIFGGGPGSLPVAFGSASGGGSLVAALPLLISGQGCH